MRSLSTYPFPIFFEEWGLDAKNICKRFDDETIQKLENIRWWYWDEKQIRKSIQAIQSGNIIELEKISNEQG